MTLKREAMELLSSFTPFSEHHQPHSFFISIDAILPTIYFASVRDGPLTRIALSPLACACFYSPLEDINIIPSSVWNNLDVLAKSKNGSVFSTASKLNMFP